MTERHKDRPPFHKTRLVCNQSQRLHDAPIQAIAIHSTESSDVPGWDDLTAVGNWFDNPASQASAHVGVDGEGHSVRWVRDDRKAWTILQLNSVTLNIEMIGRAAQPAADWETAQLKSAAKWAACWCLQYGIPARRGTVRAVNGWPVIARTGIITHKQLTDAGFGSHVDPGPGYPMKRFIEYVAYYMSNGWTLDITGD